jgi:biotin carboxyl carrier protein
VEAMKLNERGHLRREGTVVEICAQNEQVVEFGQPLFVLQVEP